MPRRGFTFTEILFAVLILGIGFIMVAGIFPVALRQTQVTSEETAGATIAKGGVAYLEKYTSQTWWSTPYNGPTGTPALADGLVHAIGPGAVGTIPVNTALWAQLGSSFILSSDPRYAWVAMYRQPFNTGTPPGSLPYVQLIVVGVQARNRSFYDSSDLAVHADGLATLQARPVTATFNQNGSGGTVAFTADGVTDLSFIADGSYVVVSKDGSGTGPTNGWIYRLGTSTGTPGQWNLAPGSDLTSAQFVPGGGATAVNAFVVGSGYADNKTATTGYSGPCQDVAVYTTFIPVH